MLLPGLLGPRFSSFCLFWAEKGMFRRCKKSRMCCRSGLPNPWPVPTLRSMQAPRPAPATRPTPTPESVGAATAEGDLGGGAPARECRRDASGGLDAAARGAADDRGQGGNPPPGGSGCVLIAAPLLHRDPCSAQPARRATTARCLGNNRCGLSRARANQTTANHMGLPMRALSRSSPSRPEFLAAALALRLGLHRCCLKLLGLSVPFYSPLARQFGRWASTYLQTVRTNSVKCWHALLLCFLPRASREVFVCMLLLRAASLT